MSTVAISLFLLLVPAPVSPDDLYRFPRPDTIRYAEEEYQSRLEWLRLQQAMHPREYWAWEAKVRKLVLWHGMWDEYDNAWNHRHNPPGCRCHLIEFRRRVGEHNWLLGRIPHYTEIE